MSTVKLAVVQMFCNPRDKQSNIDKMIGFVQEAADQGVDLIVFPEESATGFGTVGVREYSSDDKLYMHEQAELVPEGPTTQTMIEQARAHGMYLVYGIAEQDAARRQAEYNCVVLVGPEGFVGKYRKTHFPVNERFSHYTGTEFPVFDTAIGKIGLEVCYDVCFPEVARTLAIKGAEIICSPTCWPNNKGTEDDGSQVTFTAFPQARAWENQVFFINANYATPGATGPTPGAAWGSAIISPIPGRILADARYGEHMAVAEIDVATEIMEARCNATDGNEMLKDRKPGLYGALVQADPYTYAFGGGSAPAE